MFGISGEVQSTVDRSSRKEVVPFQSEASKKVIRMEKWCPFKRAEGEKGNQNKKVMPKEERPPKKRSSECLSYEK